MLFVRRLAFLACTITLVAFISAGLWISSQSFSTIPSEPKLTALVRQKPIIPIVFTSRTETTNLSAGAPEFDPFHEPVQAPWAAREGRLRLLDGSGKLYELTWNRTLDDGSTLIDVMSPSVSLDGERILFAGRKSTNDRWRIYQVHVDGSGLKQLTGSPEDVGCIATPPLRFKADGSKFTDDERRKLDYDDVDPTDLGPNGFAFASSRLPDLGRDHTKRATQIWTWAPDANAPSPVTANRNNDRWPVLISTNQILFSLWTRNREAVAADLSGVKPVSEGGEFATNPTDNWMGAIVMTNAAQFGYAIKSVEPVWRPRPLFNGRIAFMTKPSEDSPLKLAQADWGYIRTSPSSLANGETLPYEGGAQLYFGPDHDSAGNELVTACPSPAPGGKVLFAGAPATSPQAFGIYRASDNWTKEDVVPELIFDDPNFADGEPVAVYRRKFDPEPTRLEPPNADSYAAPESLKLLSGETYTGKSGYLENLAISPAIRNPIPWHDRSHGEKIDPRVNPLVSPPPNVASIAVYSAKRDRFDDPEELRIPGKWNKELVLPVFDKDNLRDWVPSNPLKPTVLVGQDSEGKVARWEGTPSFGRPGRTYFAYAGDHYSGVRPNGYHYCNGCHTGHTFLVIDPTEKTDESLMEMFKGK